MHFFSGNLHAIDFACPNRDAVTCCCRRDRSGSKGLQHADWSCRAFLNKYYAAFDFRNKRVGFALAAEDSLDKCDADLNLDICHVHDNTNILGADILGSDILVVVVGSCCCGWLLLLYNNNNSSS